MKRVSLDDFDGRTVHKLVNACRDPEAVLTGDGMWWVLAALLRGSAQEYPRDRNMTFAQFLAVAREPDFYDT